MRPFLFHLLTLFPRPYFAPMHETSELLIPCIPCSSSRAYLWACASNHNFGLLGLWIAPAVAIFGKITRSDNLGLLIWLVSFGGLRPYTASCTSNTGSIWFHLVPFSRHTVNIYRQCCHAGSFSDKIGQHCDTGREKDSFPWKHSMISMTWLSPTSYRQKIITPSTSAFNIPRPLLQLTIATWGLAGLNPGDGPGRLSMSASRIPMYIYIYI